MRVCIACLARSRRWKPSKLRMTTVGPASLTVHFRCTCSGITKHYTVVFFLLIVKSVLALFVRDLISHKLSSGVHCLFACFPGDDIDLADYTPDEVAGALKLYLRELPSSVLSPITQEVDQIMLSEWVI